MRFVVMYVLLALVFAFGFLCAATFAVGAAAPRDARRARRAGSVTRLRDRMRD